MGWFADILGMAKPTTNSSWRKGHTWEFRPPTDHAIFGPRAGLFWQGTKVERVAFFLPITSCQCQMSSILICIHIWWHWVCSYINHWFKLVHLFQSLIKVYDEPVRGFSHICRLMTTHVSIASAKDMNCCLIGYNIYIYIYCIYIYVLGRGLSCKYPRLANETTKWRFCNCIYDSDRSHASRKQEEPILPNERS